MGYDAGDKTVDEIGPPPDGPGLGVRRRDVVDPGRRPHIIGAPTPRAVDMPDPWAAARHATPRELTGARARELVSAFTNAYMGDDAVTSVCITDGELEVGLHPLRPAPDLPDRFGAEQLPVRTQMRMPAVTLAGPMPDTAQWQLDYDKDRGWLAVCDELSLAVPGNSAAQAREKARDLAGRYCEVASHAFFPRSEVAADMDRREQLRAPVDDDLAAFRAEHDGEEYFLGACLRGTSDGNLALYVDVTAGIDTDALPSHYGTSRLPLIVERHPEGPAARLTWKLDYDPENGWKATSDELGAAVSAATAEEVCDAAYEEGLRQRPGHQLTTIYDYTRAALHQAIIEEEAADAVG